MKVQASMSRSDILLNCSFPFDRELPEGSADAGDREAADYGSAFHELTAARLGPRRGRTLAPSVVATAWGIDDPGELDAHVKVSIACLLDWLKNNPFQIDWSKQPMLVEKAMALRPGVSARYISPANREHVYEEAEVYEVPGTADVLILPFVQTSPYRTRSSPRPESKNEPTVLVLDHKTGDQEDFSEPATKAQLRSLGAAAMRITRCKRAILAVLHTRRRGLPKIYADVVTLKDLHEHEAKLAIGISRKGDGSMKPGAWCKYCVARGICPTRDAELMARGAGLLEGLTAAGGLLSGETHAELVTTEHAARLSKERKLGALYLVVQQAEALAARIRTEMRNEILSDNQLLPETPDGRILTIQTFNRENLSKASIIRALGKLDGERMLTKLRKAGAIEVSEVNSLRLEDNDKRSGR